MNEEDVKNNVIIPFLNSIGFHENNLTYEDNFTIRLGKNTVKKKDYVSGRLDILVRIDNVPFMLWEIKKESLEITSEEVNQAISYARLTESITPYTIVSNGKDTQIYNTYSKKRILQNDINQNIKNFDFNESIKLRLEALTEIICYSKENLINYLQRINNRELKRVIGNKYIPELYVERQYAHKAFSEFLLNEENKMFFITGESGAGKTNVMCNLVDNNMRNSLVLFYNGCFINNSIVSKIVEDFNFEFDEQLFNRQLLNRINMLAQREGTCFLIVIDAIDELAIENPITEIDKLLNIVDDFSNIKVCLSCKDSMVKDFEEKNGVFSSLKSISKITISLNEFNEIELLEIIQRYKKYFDVTINEEIVQEIKKYSNNGFLFRIIFEIYKGKEINEKFENMELMQKYIETISKNYNIGIKDLIYTLKVLGEAFINEENDWPRLLIEENRIDNMLKVNNCQITIEQLLNINVLQRYSSDEINYLDFYFKPLSYYVITILFGELNTKHGDSFIQMLFKLNNNRRGKEALDWYDNYIKNFQYEDIFRFKNKYGHMLINQYRTIVNIHFNSIKKEFELNEDINNIGIALDNSLSCVINIYGFYKKINENDDVRLIDYKDKNSLYKNQMNGYTYTMSKIDMVEVVKSRVRKIIENRCLCESSCRFLNIEYILNMVFLYGKTFGLLYRYERINFIPNFNEFLPLDLKKLVKDIILFNIQTLKLIDELDRNIEDEEYYRLLVSGELNIPECSYSIAGKGRVPIYSIANRINKFIETFSTDIINESHLLIPKNVNIPQKAKWTSDIIIETYTTEELKKYLEDLLLKYIDEYIIIVEENFPTLKKNMSYYNLFKNGVSIELYLYTKNHPFLGKYSKKIFYCYSDKREVKVSICNEDDVPDDSKKRWKINITGEVTSLFYNNSGHKLFNNMILSNMIYELLKDDIDALFKNEDNLFEDILYKNETKKIL